MSTPLRILVVSAVLLIGCASSPAPQSADEGTSPSALWAPPGVAPFGPELQRKLTEALQAKGKAYVPRTQHLLDEKTPQFTNRLILETSPYLLQHAHNPVNWYPWGDEAFETARRLGRPVLLSIGYSTCHWCHVMEEESFEDLEIAAYLNANYIAIKVDREERPDIDSIYMSAVQMMTGRGGWPMTTWLTPERKPFFGGTYFPARDGDRGTRKGFLTLIRELRELYVEQPDEAIQRAATIGDRIRERMSPSAGSVKAGGEALSQAAKSYRGSFDTTHGGLNRAPKFPSSLSLRVLLREHERSGERAYLEMAVLTLRKMAAGGMYDQVGGGFHRYSVDARWLVPHFEKMLYDNALLAVAYVEGYQVTGNDGFARIVTEVLEYVAREMSAPGGGFYSATDADSFNPSGEREEGWFFTWTPEEIEAVVGPADAPLVAAYYNVRAGGNFEGRSILHVTRPKSEVAASLELSVDELSSRLERAKEKLYAARLLRPAPLRDDKILTSWNGLMISAFARAGFALDNEDWLRRAGRAADFLLTHSRTDGRLLRSFNDGRGRLNAYLEDYAFLIAGLLDLYETTFEVRRLEQAEALQDVLERFYRDERTGGYFLTSSDHEALLAREVPLYDGAEPSGNSIALMNLLRLAELTGSENYRKRAEQMLVGFGENLRRNPRGLSEMLLALDFSLASPKEVVVVRKGKRDGADALLQVLRGRFLPHKVLVLATQGADLEAHSTRVPWVAGKVARKGKATAYVCEQGVCQLPTSDPEVFSGQLKRRSAS